VGRKAQKLVGWCLLHEEHSGRPLTFHLGVWLLEFSALRSYVVLWKVRSLLLQQQKNLRQALNVNNLVKWLELIQNYCFSELQEKQKQEYLAQLVIQKMEKALGIVWYLIQRKMNG